jgi:hypothetical protein
VTGQDGEVGVWVSGSGATIARVFRGGAEVGWGNDGSGHTESIALRENDSVRVEAPEAAQFASITRDPVHPVPPFAGLSEGLTRERKGDMQFQVVTVDKDQKLDLQPASAAVPPDGARPAGAVPVAADGRARPSTTLWHFCGVFPLPLLKDLQPGTGKLHGTFIAHNFVAAIRLNGKTLPAPELADATTTEQVGEFWAAEGLAAERNILEINVVEVGSPDVATPLLLRLDCGGFAILAKFKSAGGVPCPPENPSDKSR